ncbi:MAG: serine hydrolase [Solidesulfovibrio sp.]|uniref:serine hydrolase n=1 Tax=Solidesulfovibrio sp. TaxID=2910990 RepID=UPI002B206392|nr:serine hydrolase [Solidesulfovibrio sp.]MEA4857314.1 serine hydrolase [Solidesulfovibrio sp.]
MVFRNQSPRAGAWWLGLVLFVCLAAPGPARADWLSQLVADAEAWRQAAQIPGMAMAVVVDDQVVYAGGFGNVSQEVGAAAVDANTVFEIGSCSKAFAAALLAVQVDKGRLAWADLAQSRLPSFAMYDAWVSGQFQVQDLLVHHSGLAMQSLLGMMVLNYPPQRIVPALRYEKPVTSFRTSFAYQNAMYMAASLLAEPLTGQSWGEALRETFFTPLGMSRTVTSQAAKNALQNVALGHMILADGGLWTIPGDWSGNVMSDYALGAGAIRSSVNDIANWLRLQLSLGSFGGTQLVSTAQMRFLQAPLALVVDYAQGQDIDYWGPVSYGGGWMYFGFSPQPFLQHGGAVQGFKASMGLIPASKAGIVVLTNIGGNFTGVQSLNARSTTADKIVFHFYDLYMNRAVTAGQLEENMARLAALQAEAPSAQAAPAGAARAAPPLEQYCGTYVHPAYGSFTVSLAGGGLRIALGPDGYTTALLAGDSGFYAYPRDYPTAANLTLPFTFAFPESGPATMTLGAVMGFPQGAVFTRIGPVAPVGLLLGDS